MSSIANLIQYVNIQMQLHGVMAWQEHYLRFRDSRDFDVCAQLLSLLHLGERNDKTNDLETFYKAELDLLKDRVDGSERVFTHLAYNSKSLNVRGMALTRLADIERNLGRFDQSAEHYQLALDIFVQLKEDTSPPYIYHMLGVIYWSQEDLEKALDYYMRSLEQYRDLSNKSISSEITRRGNIVLNTKDVQRHMSNVMRDIGETHRRAGNLSQAEEYLLESLEIQTRIGAIFEQMLSYLAIGKLNRSRGLHDQSIDYYLNALSIAQQVESPSFETAALVRLSESKYLSQDYEQSIDWAMKAKALASTHGLQNYLARAFLFQGLSMFMQGYTLQSESVDLLDTALELASHFSSNAAAGISSAIQHLIEAQTDQNNSLQKLQMMIGSYEK